MGTSSFRISLAAPQAHQIKLSEQVLHAIGVTSPVPYGTARMTIDTSAHWSERIDYVPQVGEIVVYSDRRVVDGVPYPGIKIGDGKAYVVDLPFAGDDSNQIIADMISSHINNEEVHLVPGERDNWNSKVSCSIDGERLILEGMD